MHSICLPLSFQSFSFFPVPSLLVASNNSRFLEFRSSSVLLLLLSIPQPPGPFLLLPPLEFLHPALPSEFGVPPPRSLPSPSFQLPFSPSPSPSSPPLLPSLGGGARWGETLFVEVEMASRDTSSKLSTIHFIGLSLITIQPSLQRSFASSPVSTEKRGNYRCPASLPRSRGSLAGTTKKIG